MGFMFCYLHVSLKLIYKFVEFVLYKYNILERDKVKNIILRNVIINLGVAEVDNHILRDDFFNYQPFKNVIFNLLY